MVRNTGLLLAVLFLTIAPLVTAGTSLVPSAFPSIQDALTAAQQNDTILLEPGTYSGPGFSNLVLTGLSVTIQGSDPNARPVLVLTDGRFLSLPGPPDGSLVNLRDLMMQDADTAFYVAPGGRITVSNCEFRQNTVAAALDNYSFATIDSCFFDHNGWGVAGGDETYASIIRCTFHDNYVGMLSNGLNWSFVTDCIFTKNIYAVAMWQIENVPVERCLFFGNGICIMVEYPLSSGDDPIRCNSFWKNAYTFHVRQGDPLYPQLIGQWGNFSDNPRFCDTTFTTGYQVAEASPLLPAYNTCGVLIGDVSLGCDCCFGLIGNFDQDTHESIDIADLQGYIDYLFFSQAAPLCLLEADVETNGTLDIGDLQVMVDYLFFGSLLPVCP